MNRNRWLMTMMMMMVVLLLLLLLRCNAAAQLCLDNRNHRH